MEDNQTKLNIARVRLEQTWNCSTEQTPILPPSLGSWGQKQFLSHPSFCSRAVGPSCLPGKENEVCHSFKGSLPASLPESPGARDWKGKGKCGEHLKGIFVLLAHEIHVHLLQAVCRKGWEFIKYPLCFFSLKAEFCLGTLNFAQRIYICYLPISAKERHKKAGRPYNTAVFPVALVWLGLAGQGQGYK